MFTRWYQMHDDDWCNIWSVCLSHDIMENCFHSVNLATVHQRRVFSDTELETTRHSLYLITTRKDDLTYRIAVVAMVPLSRCSVSLHKRIFWWWQIVVMHRHRRCVGILFINVVSHRHTQSHLSSTIWCHVYSTSNKSTDH